MSDTPETESRVPDPSLETTGERLPVEPSGSTSSTGGTPPAPEVTTSSRTLAPGSEETGWSDMVSPVDPLARTRASETWIAIIVFALILILLLIFVLENTKKVEISYFGATGAMPLAVAMLLSAVAGVLLTAIAGTLRILQLRRRVRKGQQVSQG